MVGVVNENIFIWVFIHVENNKFLMPFGYQVKINLDLITFW